MPKSGGDDVSALLASKNLRSTPTPKGQSAIFGLAHLLGIQLMPRIPNWEDLHLFRPSA